MERMKIELKLLMALKMFAVMAVAGDEEIKHWRDIFNARKEKSKSSGGKDRKKRAGGRRRDIPQVVSVVSDLNITYC